MLEGLLWTAQSYDSLPEQRASPEDKRAGFQLARVSALLGTKAMSLPDSLKPGIRQTHMNLAHRCMRQLWFYLYRGPSKPNYFKAVGHAGHLMLEMNYRQKKTSGVDSPITDLQDYFVSNFDQELKECDDKHDPNAQKVKDKISREAIPLYMNQEAVNIQPDLVEEPFEIKVLGINIPIIGTIDLYDTAGRLHDHKFRSGKKGPSSVKEVNRDFQLGTYEIATEAKGKKVKEVVQTQIVCNPEKEARVIPIRQEKAELDPNSILDEYAGVTRFVDMADGDPELFPMTEPSSWWCSERWCSWSSMCPRFGGKHQ